MSRDTLCEELIERKINEEKSPLIERNPKTGTNPFSCRKISACGPKFTVCGSFCHLREMVANKRGSMLDKSWQGEISTDTKPHLEKLMLESLFQSSNKQYYVVSGHLFHMFLQNLKASSCFWREI